MMSFVHMRIARPVSNLELSSHAYIQGLSLQKVADFTDHDGFSGTMLGREGLQWHLELTTCLLHPVTPLQTAEDLLVLYYPDPVEWEQACARMLAAGFLPVRAFNPYWDIHGRTFVDNDGYRTVIQNRQWPITKSD